jgi:hypothetical protein
MNSVEPQFKAAQQELSVQEQAVVTNYYARVQAEAKALTTVGYGSRVEPGVPPLLTVAFIGRDQQHHHAEISTSTLPIAPGREGFALLQSDTKKILQRAVSKAKIGVASDLVLAALKPQDRAVVTRFRNAKLTAA